MKKMKNLLKTILVISILTISTKAYAASGSISVSSGSVYVGDSFTTSVYVNAASWDVHVSASGPVTNCSINEANVSDDAMDTSRTFTANCVTTGEGTVTVTLSGNVTGQSDDYATGVSGSRSVTVVKKEEPTPQPDPTPTPDPKPDEKKEEKKEEKKSNNAKLKEISIEGYNLVKVNDNNYTLKVDNKVEKINIKATAEDSKSKITGTGEKVLKVGENVIEVICKAEDGTENKITIKVTRAEEEKKVTPTKTDTKNDTKTDTKEKDTKNLKTNLLVIILFIIDLVLSTLVIILSMKNNKLRKNMY